MNAIEEKIETVKKVRLFLLDKISGLTAEQLNKIPAGFNNNITWNLGHLIAAQQGICYARIGLATRVDGSFFDAYKPGSKPSEPADEASIETIKEMLTGTLPVFLTDYHAGIFNNYTSWTTRYGVTLNNVEEAIDFLLFHEGLHSGVITTMAKLV